MYQSVPQDGRVLTKDQATVFALYIQAAFEKKWRTEFSPILMVHPAFTKEALEERVTRRRSRIFKEEVTCAPADLTSQPAQD